MIRLWLIALVVLLPSMGVAYEEARARANLASELAECAAYFTIAAEGIRRAGNVDAATSAENASLAAMMASSDYSTKAVATARVELALIEQIDIIDRDYANLALLVAKYGEHCKTILEQPDRRLEYWRGRE